MDIEEPRADDDREVDVSEDAGGVGLDDRPIFAEQTRDDTDDGWGERVESNDDRLMADRPPHWG